MRKLNLLGSDNFLTYFAISKSVSNIKLSNLLLNICMQGVVLGVGSEEKGEKDCKFQLFVEKKNNI